jgi:hypothetical protein
MLSSSAQQTGQKPLLTAAVETERQHARTASRSKIFQPLAVQLNLVLQNLLLQSTPPYRQPLTAVEEACQDACSLASLEHGSNLVQGLLQGLQQRRAIE